AARAQVDAAARSAAVFGGELIANDLHFFNSFDRGREALGGRPIVVVVEPVDRDVVRICRAARQRETPGFFGGGSGSFIVSQIARRERLFANAAEREDQIERRARGDGQTLDLASRDCAAHNRAGCIDLGWRSDAYYHS